MTSGDLDLWDAVTKKKKTLYIPGYVLDICAKNDADPDSGLGGVCETSYTQTDGFTLLWYRWFIKKDNLKSLFFHNEKLKITIHTSHSNSKIGYKCCPTTSNGCRIFIFGLTWLVYASLEAEYESWVEAYIFCSISIQKFYRWISLYGKVPKNPCPTAHFNIFKLF